jgi:hypothetical protein
VSPQDKATVADLAQHLVYCPTLVRDVAFDAKVHGFVGAKDLAEFTLWMDPSELTWTALPTGNRRSEVSIIVASFSDDGTQLDQEFEQFELIRDEVHLPITGDGPFRHSLTASFPAKTSRVRFAVRDLKSGRIGMQDFSLSEISTAPQKPTVIR